MTVFGGAINRERISEGRRGVFVCQEGADVVVLLVLSQQILANVHWGKTRFVNGWSKICYLPIKFDQSNPFLCNKGHFEYLSAQFCLTQ